MTVSHGIFALTKALKGKGILTDDHLLMFTPLPIPSRSTAVPGWFLQLANKNTGSLTRFYLCGIPVEDSSYKVIQFSSLFGVIDEDDAAMVIAAGFEYGAIRASDAAPDLTKED